MVIELLRVFREDVDIPPRMAWRMQKRELIGMSLGMDPGIKIFRLKNNKGNLRWDS